MRAEIERLRIDRLVFLFDSDAEARTLHLHYPLVALFGAFTALAAFGAARLDFCGTAAQEGAPAVFRHFAGVLFGLADRQFRDGVNDPVEVVLAHGIDVGVRCRVHEIDGVRNPVLAGKLHGIEIVPQGAAERQRVALHAFQQLGIDRRRVLHVALVERRRRIVVHDVHFFLADHVASEVFLELHAVLQRHAEIAALVVGLEELFRRIDLVHVLPAAAIERLQERRKSDIAEDAVPRKRELQVAHRAVGGADRVLLVGQQDGLGNCHAELLAQREVEELVVGAPPEWVVDDDCAGKRGVLEISAVERYVVRDAVNDDVVGRRLRHANFPHRSQFRLDPRLVHEIDFVDQGRWKGGLHPEDDADFLHLLLLWKRHISQAVSARKSSLEVPGNQRWMRSKVTIIVGENPRLCEPKSAYCKEAAAALAAPC